MLGLPFVMESRVTFTVVLFVYISISVFLIIFLCLLDETVKIREDHRTKGRR